MNDLIDFESLRVSIASPEMIRSWSFGEVTKPETINYRTLKAEKDGLFSENIFGPTKDYECYCGKYKRIRYRGVICDKCGVEVTQSKVRRERMGHITLAAPVAHNWYVKGAPSKLSLILDLTMKNLEAIIYFASYLVISVDSDAKNKSLERLEKQLEEKKEASKKSLDEAIEKAEAAVKHQITDLKTTIKETEKREIVSQELQLASRQNIAALREAHSTELSQLEQIYKTVADLAKSVVPLRLLSEDEYYKLEEYEVADFMKVGMGAESLLQVLRSLDLDKLAAELRDEVSKTSGQRHIKATKRLRIIEGMRNAKMRPEWMVLTVLPVLPPDLRPMVQLPGGRFATSDLNDLYRRVINRNNRLRRLIDLGAPEIILRNEKRMLQEAVDSLIDTTARTSRRVAAGTHQLRSLSDMLRGKQGRFRQNLLGKRVDYSGRSVIIVGPKLKLNQVGVPKEMALEMFKPFVLREMMARGLASNVKGAKNLLELKPSEVWDILEQVIENHPVLINRAPTLHRLGIQSFFPVLVDGNSIQIHPCICAGFNADFDGDQMAIHVPLSEKAREEAIELMMAKENILKGSDGSPINVPNREMALGSFYITSIDQSKEFDEKQIYTKDEAILAYQTSKLPLRKLIKCEVNGEIYETTVGRIIFNNVIPEKLRFINEAVNGVAIRKIVMGAFRILNREELAVLVDDIKALGFWGSTISGLSLAISDNKILPNKKDMIAAGDKEIEEIEENYKKGLITTEERRELSQEVWTRIGEDIARKTIAEIEPDNPIKVIMQSGGARATVEQIKQVSGMRGFSVDATGKIVELPTKSNYREGLGVFEYFNSCRGARKGLVDKGLRTADAGYLTRRLVDVSHDTIIRSEECETEEGLTLTVDINNPGSNTPSLLGRRLLKKAVGKDKKTVLEAGAYLEEDQISQLVEAQVEEVTVRSPLTCQARYGICSNCYGLDLSTRKPVKMGVPVGVIAAQSIGEPGTQLTMRTFHTGGILGADITAGLPRVEELFEARTPKIISPVSEIAGKVSIIENEEGRVVRVRTTTKPHEEREYTIALSANILVEDGDLISAGTQLTAGPLDVKEVLRVKGLREAQRYIVSEVKKVYESQGVSINEKHFEVIVRKMSDKVRVETQGDTNLLPGEVVDRIRFEEENKRVLSEGGEPATAGVVILGITRASLLTESFLSAASFQETTTVLADAAAQGKVDKLLGMKENVIIGRLIPTSADRAALE